MDCLKAVASCGKMTHSGSADARLLLSMVGSGELLVRSR